MKIVIMGSGGVGGYFGGLLARAGHEVTFIARGAHLQAIRTTGLQVKGVLGDFIIKPATATDTLAKIGHVDLVLICVKTTDTDEAAQSIKPIIGPNTIVISLQNGVDAAERIGKIVGMEHVLGGAIWVAASIESPGLIRQVSQYCRVVIGELDGRITPRAQAIFEAFKSTKATVELSDNILKVIWTKFVFFASISGVGALTRVEVGGYRSIPETRALLNALMHEVEAVGRALGIAFDTDVVNKTLTFIDNAAPAVKSAMQRDVELGRPSEMESIIGIITHKGHELKVPTPVADMIYAFLLPGERKAMAKNRE